MKETRPKYGKNGGNDAMSTIARARLIRVRQKKEKRPKGQRRQTCTNKRTKGETKGSTETQYRRSHTQRWS